MINIEIKFKCMKCKSISSLTKNIDYLCDFRQYRHECNCGNTFRTKFEVVSIKELNK